MTNKKLDRKFMSWVWGIIRFFPIILFFAFIIYYTFMFKGLGFFYDNNDNIINYFTSIFTSGNDDYIFDTITYDILPLFLKDALNSTLDVFGLLDLGYLETFVVTFVFYQLWVSILQILFNVIMILPNITNYFIEKFNHLGNKGDY